MSTNGDSCSTARDECGTAGAAHASNRAPPEHCASTPVALVGVALPRRPLFGPYVHHPRWADPELAARGTEAAAVGRRFGLAVMNQGVRQLVQDDRPALLEGPEGEQAGAKRDRSRSSVE